MTSRMRSIPSFASVFLQVNQATNQTCGEGRLERQVEEALLLRLLTYSTLKIRSIIHFQITATGLPMLLATSSRSGYAKAARRNERYLTLMQHGPIQDTGRHELVCQYVLCTRHATVFVIGNKRRIVVSMSNIESASGTGTSTNILRQANSHGMLVGQDPPLFDMRHVESWSGNDHADALFQCRLELSHALFTIDALFEKKGSYMNSTIWFQYFCRCCLFRIMAALVVVLLLVIRQETVDAKLVQVQREWCRLPQRILHARQEFGQFTTLRFEWHFQPWEPHAPIGRKDCLAFV
jgi:hypothetical protein